MYKHELSYMVSNKDLKQKIHTNNLKIIEYPELRFCNNIIDLLPQDMSVLVILIETKPNCGHWTTCIRANNIITYFDSYGVRYDGELKNIDTKDRVMLHEDKPYLTALLNKAKTDGFKIEYNKVKFQEYASGINTCGKHCIAVANALLDGLTLKQYQQLMKEKVNDFKMSYDKLVCELYNTF
jgi:hypothetical protein